ncbi:MAG: helix-turn-helix transcriptional regulator [Erysipelotrichaceae bacterium]|nr:helix-turn-helix transcriptional regulator [Erysipelotrichaceae bacterium]
MTLSESGLQDQFCSDYDKAKLCSYDIEIIDGPTRPLIHQAGRFLLFRQGKGVMKINERAYDISPGSFAAILPWDTSEVTQVSQPLQFVKVIFNFDFVNRFLRVTGAPPANVVAFLESSPLVDLDQQEMKNIEEICRVIKNEVGVESAYLRQQDRELSELMAGNKLAELMINFKRLIISRQGTQLPNRSREPGSRSGIFRYIYAHLGEYMTAERLSEVFSLPQAEIVSYVREMTGFSLSDYINEARIAKVCDLLVHTRLPLTDIALITGFTDASHLVKSFSKRMHVSPGEYRQAYLPERQVLREDDSTLGFAAVSYVNDYYMEDLRSTEVARHFGTSVVELNRALLYVIEMNFEEFLNYKRINRAAELLLESDMAEIDVCMEVGYNNIKTFTRNFVKLKNIRPGDFRRQYTLQQGDESIPAETEE